MIQALYRSLCIPLSPTSNISTPHARFQAQSQGLRDFAGRWGLCTLPAARSLPPVPSDDQFSSGEASGDAGSPQTAPELGTDLWLVGLVVSGFSPQQKAGGADPPAFWPIVTVPVSPVSRQQHAEARGTQGLRASFFNKSPVLIWSKGVSASVFLEKKDQAFLHFFCPHPHESFLRCLAQLLRQKSSLSTTCRDVDLEEIYDSAESKLPSLWVHFKDPELRAGREMRDAEMALGDAFHLSSVVEQLWASLCRGGTRVVESMGRAICSWRVTLCCGHPSWVPPRWWEPEEVMSYATCGTWQVY